VLAGRNCSYEVYGFEGNLSIKTVVSGEAVWQTGKKRTRIDSGTYLVLNHGQRYDIEIRTPKPTQTFCVFFQAGFVEEIKASLTTQPLEDLRSTTVEFSGSPDLYGPVLSPALARLWNISSQGLLSSESGHEGFRDVAEALLVAQGLARDQIDRVPLCNSAAREEVAERLQQAKELILDSYSKELSLERMAAEACLSPHHFHHLFKQSYGLTPYRLLTDRRLERARRLLLEGHDSVEAVCTKVGYSSTSSFAKLFRRRFGLLPSQVRQESEDSTLT